MSGIAQAEPEPARRPGVFVPDLKLHHQPMPMPMSDTEAEIDPLPGMPESEMDERERFLDAAIQHNAHLTQAWHGVVTGGYALGFVVEAARAVSAKHPSPRFDLSYGAAKAAFGVAGRMARPVRAVFGPSPKELYPGDSHAARAQRLVAAEEMLRIDAKQNDNRYKWYSHTINLVLNLAGGLVTGLYYHDWARGASSIAVGVAVGEASIWTQPWQAKRAYKKDKQRYGLSGSSSGASSLSSPPAPKVGHGPGLLSMSF